MAWQGGGSRGIVQSGKVTASHSRAELRICKARMGSGFALRTDAKVVQGEAKRWLSFALHGKGEAMQRMVKALSSAVLYRKKPRRRLCIRHKKERER